MVTRSAKSILLLEVAICFAPMTLVLLLGVIMVPLQVGFLFAGEFSGLSLIAIVAMGIAGLVALFNVVRWLLIRPSYSLNAKVVLLLMCLGCVPLVVISVVGDTEVWRLLAALPLICTAHLTYLARDYLFATWTTPGS
jgi:hypothetical protein